MNQQDATLVIDVTRTNDLWCVFEHHMSMQPGEPPVVIYVNACRLIDVYKLQQGRLNSEWTRIFANGGNIMVRVIATGERSAIVKHAMMHSRSFNPMPHCNLRGMNLNGITRRLMCSNGMEYSSQAEAAEALDLSQSAISQHLRGKSQSVKGYVFTYAGAGT